MSWDGIKKYVYFNADHKDSLDRHISKDVLNNQLIIRDETENVYIVVPYDYPLPLTHSLHEVILGSQPQKLKFDIEWITPTKDPDATITLQTIKDAIQKIWKTTYFIDTDYLLVNDDILVFTSSGYINIDKYKNSYHLIIAPKNYAAADNINSMLFTRKVYHILPADIKRCIDMQVNKSIQNFRILGCSKLNSSRPKVYVSGKFGDNLLLASLITNTKKLTILPNIINDMSPSMTPDETVYTQLTPQQLMYISKLVGPAFTFREQKDNFILFDRVEPSFCYLCQEIHHKDNTLIISINDDLVSLSEICRHAKGKYRVIGQLSQDPATTDPSPPDTSAFNNANNYSELQSIFYSVPGRNIYDEPYMRNFEKSRTLCVQAPMKMGKTKALLKFLQDNYPVTNVIYEPVIRMVTFRQTFAQHVFQNFQKEGFVLYNKIQGPITQSRVILQAESLHRLQVQTEPIDVLILDECESIIEQIDSGLFKQFGNSFARFEWMMRTAKVVICMDALLNDRTFRVIEKIRGIQGMIFHCNCFKRSAEDTYMITQELQEWYISLFQSLSNNERVFIPTNSLIDAEAVKMRIEENYPHLKIGFYTSKYPDEATKKEHFANVDKYWSEYDVLITTPTVSAGVSFEVKRYDRVYGYFTDQSCTIETCIQMLGRVRDVALHNYVLYIKAVNRTLPVNSHDILETLKLQRLSLKGELNTNFLSYSFTDEGDVVFHDSNYLTIHVENIRIRNLSKNKFLGRIIWSLKQFGANIIMLPKMEPADNLWDKEHKEAKVTAKTIDANMVANAEDITAEEAESFIRKMQQDTNSIENEENSVKNTVSTNNILSLRKYNLRKQYQKDPTESVSTGFALIYLEQNNKRVYKNLTDIKDIANGKLPMEVIKNIQSNERNYRESLFDVINIRAPDNITDQKSWVLNTTDMYDLNHKYKYDYHRVSQGLLSACGFTSILDTQDIQENKIKDYLKNNYNELSNKVLLDTIKSTFQIEYKVPPVDDIKFLQIFLCNINRILSLVYDANIVKTSKMKHVVTTFYNIRQSQYFRVTEEGVETTVI